MIVGVFLFVGFLVFSGLVVLATWLFVERRRLLAELVRFRPIQDVEAARIAMEQANTARAAQTQTWFEQKSGEAAQLQLALAVAQARLADLGRSVAILEEQDGLHEVAFYKSRFGLESSAEYSSRIDAVRSHQKIMLQNGEAARCTSNWNVDGNQAKGRKMVEEHLRLMLRAFNGECDACVARVNYKNVQTLRLRVEKAAESITKLGKTKGCSIEPTYVRLKLDELFLVHEYQEKLEAEREEQRRIRAQMAEEQRDQREREKALREAEKDEARFSRALLAAQRELEQASVAARTALEAQIAELQQRILDAQRKKSQAELTRAGYVYVISNVGSFGEHIFKLGMTRRLDPMDRVWELSDASVPFDFDVHAMIYTEDAPTLENRLHRHFEAVRVNKINLKREFFRVRLDEIEPVVRRFAPSASVTFTLLAEAEEYRKTLAIEHERARSLPQPPPIPTSTATSVFA